MSIDWSRIPYEQQPTDILCKRIAELEATIERIRAAIESGPEYNAGTWAAWGPHDWHAWAKRVVAEAMK